MTLEAQIAEALASAPSYHAFLGALIGGAVSLIGGIAGRNDAKKRDKAAAAAAQVPQVTTQSPTTTMVKNVVDVGRMMSDAERAGFNPVTFLNAGGLGAYSWTEQTNSGGTTTTTGHNAMAAVPTAPSFGSVLAGAAQSGFDIYRQDQQIANAQAHESGLLSMQLSSVGSARAMQSGATSRSFSSAGSRKVAGALTVGHSPMGAPTVPVVGETTVTNPHRWMSVDPSFTDAEMAETRYGDIMQEVYGWRNQLSDWSYALTGVTFDEAYKSLEKGYRQKGGPIIKWSTGPQPGYGSTLFNGLGVTIKKKAPVPQPQTSGGGGW